MNLLFLIFLSAIPGVLLAIWLLAIQRHFEAKERPAVEGLDPLIIEQIKGWPWYIPFDFMFLGMVLFFIFRDGWTFWLGSVLGIFLAPLILTKKQNSIGLFLIPAHMLPSGSKEKAYESASAISHITKRLIALTKPLWVTLTGVATITFLYGWYDHGPISSYAVSQGWGVILLGAVLGLLTAFLSGITYLLFLASRSLEKESK